MHHSISSNVKGTFYFYYNKTSRLLVVLVLVLNGFELILTSYSRKTGLAIDSQCCLQPAGEVYCIKDINKMATSTVAFPFRLLTHPLYAPFDYKLHVVRLSLSHILSFPQNFCEKLTNIWTVIMVMTHNVVMSVIYGVINSDILLSIRKLSHTQVCDTSAKSLDNVLYL